MENFVDINISVYAVNKIAVCFDKVWDSTCCYIFIIYVLVSL